MIQVAFLSELIIENSEGGRTDACFHIITKDLGRSLGNHDHANKETRGVRVNSLLTELPDSSTVSVENVCIAISSGTITYTVSVTVIFVVLLGSNDDLPVVRGVFETSSSIPSGELLSLVERNKHHFF